jgi:beta-lactam-binding protein with PASTA domain
MFSDKVPKNKIMSQDPLSGRLLDKGGAVYVVISNGSEAEAIAAQEAAAAMGMASVPTVLRKSEDEAIALLTERELAPRVTERREDSSVAAGKVISQSIAGGTTVEKGTVVNLVISLGRKDAPPSPSPSKALQSPPPPKTQPSPPSVSPPPSPSKAPPTPTPEPPAPSPSKAPASVGPTGISLSRSSATLVVGKTLSLSATVQPSNANDKSVVWSSSNPGVASVSANGTVTASAPGKARIYAKTKNGDHTASCDIEVEAPPPPEL